MRKVYILVGLMAAIVGCSDTSTLHSTNFSTANQVWVIQKQPDHNDHIILCNSTWRPTVCVQVWDGTKSTHGYIAPKEIDNTLIPDSQ